MKNIQAGEYLETRRDKLFKEEILNIEYNREITLEYFNQNELEDMRKEINKIKENKLEFLH